MKNNYILGKKSLYDAINNKLDIEVVYLLNNNSFDLQILLANKIKFEFKQISFFNQFKGNKKHTIAFKIKNENKSIDLLKLLDLLNQKENGLILILDEIQDVGNLGAILRTANAFAVDAIIYKKNNQADPFNPIVIKNSTNAINYLLLCEVTNINNAIKLLKDDGFWIYCSAIDKNAISYYKENYHIKSAIVIGNENKGVSKLVQENSDVKITIPQYGNVQSLNVSVATGILLADYRTKYLKKI